MASINLYKIDNANYKAFFIALDEKMKIENEKYFNGNDMSFCISLHTPSSNTQKELSWNWILSEFDVAPQQTFSGPSCIVVIENKNSELYAISFGHAYFLLDKFCDKDFAFSYARKLDYETFRLTSLVQPNSLKNKTVNSYINYDEIEFSSGEAFTKIKATTKLPVDFTLYSPTIEIGSSLKLKINTPDLETIRKIILHVENVLLFSLDKVKIPVFKEIKSKERITELDKILQMNIENNNFEVVLPEIEVIGSLVLLSQIDDEVEVMYGGNKQNFLLPTQNDLIQFCLDNVYNYHEIVLEMKLKYFSDGNPRYTEKIKNIINYSNDDERCVLIKGKWYHYNDDYLEYLTDSIREISISYNPQHDFTDIIHQNFLSEMYNKEKNNAEYLGKKTVEIKKSLKNKYYAERAYNMLRAQHDGYENFDRAPERVEGHLVEVMDLYKDGTMFAIKIGSSSEKLCYAIDQSLVSMKLYKAGKLSSMPDVKNVGLWLVLSRSNALDTIRGKPDLSSLKMISFKNKIDEWKKEVRLAGFTPIIYINYRN